LAAAGPAEAISCLLVPLACVKPHRKYGEEMDGTVFRIRSTKTTYEAPETPVYEGNGFVGLENTKEYYVWFKVGQTVYQGYKYENAVGMITSYKPKNSDWYGRTVKLRFADKKVLGYTSAWVQLQRPDGKEWELNLVSIVGPDGINECSKWQYCPPQAKIDRAAREAEELASMQKAGKPSVTDVLPVEPASPAPPAAPPPAAPPAAATAAAPGDAAPASTH
jgi:hypothetical protein